MAIKLTSTKDVSQHGVKSLVYGFAGSGKTTLIKTMPSPVILSAEGGLLSLSDEDIPYIQISSMGDLQEAYEWCLSDEAAVFDSVCLDSLSEIAEVVLHAEKAKAKDPRAAYGALQDTMAEMIRAFRDLPNKNVLFTAKLEKVTDEQGRILYGPSMPGNKLSQMVPYFFDLVFALRVEKDDEGETYRALMTDSDGLWQAKSRTTETKPLAFWEPADMGAVISKLRGE